MTNTIQEALEIKLLQEQLDQRRVVALAGGVGGAKLAAGLAHIIPPEQLTIIVNTGDDFHHFGLTICPDLDTILYTLADLANPETGWGRRQESWRTIGEIGRLGGPEWFKLGDLDLATHLLRTHLLAEGKSLTEVTQHLSQQWGIGPTVLPMSDQPAPTLIQTSSGTLPFQEWFVAERWQPVAEAILLPEDVRATPQVLTALEKADLLLLAPSNPFVSLDPILNVYPIRAMITDLPQLVLAVSPIIGGQAVKGPAAKMMRERGMTPSAAAVANYYADLIDAFIYDEQDAGQLTETTRPTLCTNTLMKNQADRVRLAGQILHFSMELINK